MKTEVPYTSGPGPMLISRMSLSLCAVILMITIAKFTAIWRRLVSRLSLESVQLLTWMTGVRTEVFATTE